MRLADVFPIVWDVSEAYKESRRDGVGRGDAIAKILGDFSNELGDTDDGPQVWIGLAKAAGEKKELTEELLEQAKAAYSQLIAAFPEEDGVLNRSMKSVCNPEKLGGEAHYGKRRRFDPGWKIGDTFAYHMDDKFSRDLGLEGWYAIIRKVEEAYAKGIGLEQIVYLSICPPDRLPNSAEELEQLGYIAFQRRCDRAGRGYECRANVYFSSQKKVDELKVQKIGCFPETSPPQDEYVNPYIPGAWNLNPMPAAGDRTGYSDIEFYACWGYKQFGVVPALDQPRGIGDVSKPLKK